jgi:hypothetical protein
MVSRCAQNVIRVRLLTATALCVAWSLGAAGVCQGQWVGITKIEEDWELVVGTPDAALAAPQTTCTIAPAGNLDGLHATLELNLRSDPSFSPGGVQLQLWNGEEHLATRTYVNYSALATAGETIRWTTKVRRTMSGDLIFEVVSGESSTWGDFGGQGYLRAEVDGSLLNLDTYDPDVSVENSGIGFASNRVQSLVLKEVRVTTVGGIVHTDSTDRVVHQQ